MAFFIRSTQLKGFVLVSLLLVLISTQGKAQYSKLLHKPHIEQKEILSDLYLSASDGGLPFKAFADTIAGMRELAIKEKDPNLLMEADLLEAFYKVSNGLGTVDLLIQVQKESKAKGFQYIASRAANAIAGFYWGDMEFQKSIHWHLLLDELISKMTIEEFPDKAIFLQQIGNDFFFFGDYNKSISYFRRVAELPLDEFYIYAYRHSFNNLGLSYREIGNLDSSDYYFERLLVHADSTSEQWVGIASGNLGFNHFIRGEFDAAIPYLETDIRIAEQFKDFGLAVGSCIPLADLYVQQGNLSKAKGYIAKAEDYIHRSGETDRFAKLYPVMSKWEAAMNHPQLATAYLDSALIFQKRISEKFSALKLMRANQEVMASKREREILKLQDEAKRNKMTRNFIIGGLILLLVVFLVVYQIQDGRNKAERKLKTVELEQTHLQLENARSQLKTYLNKINDNSRIIQSLEKSQPTAVQQKLLDELKKSTILTEVDWDSFQKQFAKVFPGLIADMQKKYPSLSPAELRFLLLTKLEIPKGQIANALGVSPASLRVTWYRIRKKLDLPKDFSASQFFEKFVSES
ncbi:tetratricopeptide repeat protein [Echinicola salinicaeni]|uniref:tetratricopeptide repeat protein n=1 Tax=Echinicola salinicaeni TaxID=2762757 RepID=UPI001646D781|nr:tetratricopeptide repeat protein [Echinicola salinicaeni]